MLGLGSALVKAGTAGFLKPLFIRQGVFLGAGPILMQSHAVTTQSRGLSGQLTGRSGPHLLTGQDHRSQDGASLDEVYLALQCLESNPQF